MPRRSGESFARRVRSRRRCNYAELLIGEVTHYWSRPGVAGLSLSAPLHKGDLVHILGHTTDMEEAVTSLEIDHRQIDHAQPGDDVAMKVQCKVRGSPYQNRSEMLR